MTRIHEMQRRPTFAGRILAAAALLAGLGLGACDSLLDVDNPNNVKEEDLTSPTAAAAMVNGVLSRLATAYSSFLMDNGAASDEFRFVGSRDAYFQIDVGNWTDPNNEFSDATFPQVSQARWWADEVIKRLEQFRSDGTLPDETDLARVYLYGAVVYTLIPDHYDDFVIGSDRRKCATPGVPECAPVGEANMVNLYDTAIEYVDKGLAIARAAGNTPIELQLMAMRAKANFHKALWAKVNPSIAPDPLVASTAAAADAQAFLGRVGDLAWRFQFAYSATTQASTTGSWVNSRLEFRQGDPYITPTANNKDYVSTKMTDIIETTKVSPILDAIADEFDAAQLYPPSIVVSARDMHLILAETELAAGNTAGFATHINHLRTADALEPYSPGAAGHPDPIDMLVHARQTNLYLQGRRLLDHYRFGIPSVDWQSQSEAVRAPGTLFPITRIERDANPNVR